MKRDYALHHENPPHCGGFSWSRAPIHIERSALQSQVASYLGAVRATEVVGPRQVGKTTLAREFVAPGSSHSFDLENPVTPTYVVYSGDHRFTLRKGIEAVPLWDAVPR